MQALQYLQTAVSIGFFICLGLYLYYLVVRIRQKIDVDFKLWSVVALGLLLSISSQFIGVALGTAKWINIKWTVIISGVLFFWALFILYKKKFPKEKPEANPKQGKGSKGNNKGNKDSKGNKGSNGHGNNKRKKGKKKR